MSSGKQGSWDIPKYTANPASYSNPYGTSYFRNNTYGTDLSSGTQDYYNQLDAMRKAIYSGLGYTSPAREASLNQWQQTFEKEALRNTQPQLEQSLFARGLGGSKYYSDSLTDLLSKTATQGVLNREQLSQNDQNMQLQYLASINPEIANILSQSNALTSGTSNQEQQGWNRYQQMLPYNTMYNDPGNSGLAGAGKGVVSGATAGSSFGPLGALIGAILGGGTGYMSSKEDPSQTPMAFYNQGAGTTGTTGGTGGINLNDLVSIYNSLNTQGGGMNLAQTGQSYGFTPQTTTPYSGFDWNEYLKSTQKPAQVMKYGGR